MNTKLEIKIVGLVVCALLVASALLATLSTRFIRNDVHLIVDSYSDLTLNVIRDAVIETMISGNPEVTKKLIERHSKTGHIPNLESLMVLDPEGKAAFSSKEKVGPEDRVMIENLRRTNMRSETRTDTNILYYEPLFNTDRCSECHTGSGHLLGALKVSISIEGVQKQILYRKRVIVATLLIATVLFGCVLWVIFRMTVITPIRKIEDTTRGLSRGDLSFNTGINTPDEMGRLSTHIRKAVRDIGKIIKRVGTVSRRVAGVSREIEKGSKDILDGTHVESQAVKHVRSSVDELNKSITTVAMAVEDFSVSAIDGVTASNDMLVNTEQINKNTHNLSEAVDSTSSSIEEISANIKDVARRSEELSTSAEEAVSAIGEITSSIREIESSTKESSQLAEKAVSDATEFGIAAVQKTFEGMEKIKTDVMKTADFINKLDERSKDIGKILDVIDDVTDQTSLLSFNAAILAAQSGDHGKGFSVVADEIKGLAERTSFSTQEIAALIESVRSEVRSASLAMSEGIRTVEEGSTLSTDAKKAFEQILASLKSSTEMTLGVERATSEQSESISFVSDTMERVREMISHIAHATAEYSEGITQIVLASDQINEATQTVRQSTASQLKGGKALSGILDNFSEKALEISKALKEAKLNSDAILHDMSQISSFPEENRARLSVVNRNIRNLTADVEVLLTELKDFHIEDEKKGAVITLGVIPLESPAEMYRRFLPLSEYLSGRLNEQVELKMEVNYDDTIKDIGEGITDLCYMTPSTFIRAHEQYGVEVLLKALRHGTPYHRIVIIARKGGSITTVSDIRGHSFAFGDVLSTSSYLIPKEMLREEGIDLNDLSYHDFLGHHDDVARAVLKGDFDAGGVMESVAEQFRSEGLVLLKHSMNVPEFNICVNRDMTAQRRTLIKEALLALTIDNETDKAVLESISSGYTGFVEARDDDYKEIKKLMRKSDV